MAQTVSGTHFGCVNNTIKLRSGRYFDFADPQPDSFTFADIAGALSKICRFGGQSPYFYSVAEHLWHCGNQAEQDNLHDHAIQAAIMHDATEAFDREAKHVKKIDREMLIAERRALFGKDGVTWAGENNVRELRVGFAYWSPSMAEQRFTVMAMAFGIDTTA